nr:hypothetical protein [Nonlabens ulvanivorans]
MSSQPFASIPYTNIVAGLVVNNDGSTTSPAFQGVPVCAGLS